jgi:[ribosomal protein S18]-alanine N-acetyltransferase
MNAKTSALEFRKLTREWKEPLLLFLRQLEDTKDSDHFRPHPFVDEAVDRILATSSRDLYYLLTESVNVLGYGMLRGWDEGYDIPSLGIAIHPAWRGEGLGKAFMIFLHAAAKTRGATKIRLRVHERNSRAMRMYEAMGYKFETREGGYRVGLLDLAMPCASSGAERVVDQAK